MGSQKQIASQVGRQTQSQRQNQAQRQAQAAALKPIMTQSAEAVQRLMMRLVQRGEIILDDMPDEDMEEAPDEEVEMDAELTLADEDEVASGDDGSDDEEFVSGGPSFDIRVVPDGHGGCFCVPPDNEWADARAAKGAFQARGMLDALADRHWTFAKISEWLTMVEGAQLAKGAESFLLSHGRIKQTEFAKKSGIDSKKLSHYIENAWLRWDDESIPLRELFSP